TFIERDLGALALIKRNVAALEAEDKALVMSADAANLPRAAIASDLALLDPPYGETLAAPALVSLGRQGWLKPGALVRVETGAEETLGDVDGFETIDRRTYGRAAVTFLVFEN